MSRRRDIPSNETVTTVPVFTPDPYGFHQFAGALEATTLGLSNGITPVIDARGSGRWHGWTNGLQDFRAATPGRVAGGSAPVPTTTRLDQTSGSAVSTPVQAIFEERMAARRFS